VAFFIKGQGEEGQRTLKVFEDKEAQALVAITALNVG
jgi:hypothetical protein